MWCSLILLLCLPTLSTYSPKVSLSYRLSQLVQEQCRLFITLKGEEHGEARLPLSLSLIFDESQSLDQEDIRSNIATVLGHLDSSLSESDHVGLYSFDETSEKEVELVRYTHGSLERLRYANSTASTDGNTNLLNAIKTAVNQQRYLHNQGELVQGVIVFTNGKTDLNDEEIDSSLQEIKSLIDANGHPIIIYLVAFKSESDGGLVDRISEVGNGGVFRVCIIEDIGRTFGVILGSLMQTYYTNIWLEIGVPDNMVISQVQASRGFIQSQEQATKVWYSNLQGSEVRDMVLDIKCMENQKQKGLINIDLKYYSYQGGYIERIFYIDPNEAHSNLQDPVVQVNKARIQVAHALLEGSLLLIQGEIDKVEDVINVQLQNVQQLIASGIVEALQNDIITFRGLGRKLQTYWPEDVIGETIVQNTNINYINTQYVNIQDTNIQLYINYITILEKVLAEVLAMLSTVSGEEETDKLFCLMQNAGNSLQDQRLQIIALSIYKHI
eukprot:TRINITY_DN75344_c0_g1_i1.p1 TRINITY_DN75344_c0_g1~~TRINITY_DN75344_c0_g1_i1.p1  ORF type:complete len:498 (+),score=25.37 TRINITY_DN75344_c0_g1_i1:105-1598(+)